MILDKIRESLKYSNDSWRMIDNYNIGDIIAVKYQYAGIGLKVRKFVGYCIAKNKKVIGSTLLLRNVINNNSVEMLIFVDSNKVISIQKLNYKRNKVRRSKLYYLRDKSLSKSKVNL